MNRALTVGSLLVLAGVAGCSQTAVTPRGAADVAADSADQVMYKMSTRLTEGGVLRSFVEADTAYVYQNEQRMNLRAFKVRMLDAQGNLQSTLTAERGEYLSITGKLDARGHVVVESTDGRILRTEHLIYDKGANQIKSDTVFTYKSPTEEGSGNGFVSDIEFRNVQVKQPRGAQKGKGLLLPGQ